jgi:imidazolonepropionase-like amidohydrolase
VAWLLASLVAVTPSFPAHPQTGEIPTWIRGATLLDGTGGPPVGNAWVVFRGERIAAAGPAGSFEPPEPARVIRAGGCTLLPGLVDAHVHLGGSGVIGSTFLRPQPTGMEFFLRNLRSDLLGGVTTVRDLHMPVEVGQRLAAALRKNPTRGSRLVYAGPILTSPGGYGSPYAVPVATPEEGRLRVRELHREGARAVKIALTSRKLGGPPVPAMGEQVARAIVEEAHLLAMPVAAHVAGGTAADVRAALRAGVDSLEHLPGIWDPVKPPDTRLSEPDLLEELLSSNPVVVPTLSAEAGDDFGPTLPSLFEDPALSLKLTEEQRGVLRRNVEDFRRNPRRQTIARAGRERFQELLREVGMLHRAGVRIAAGSDAGAGFTFHGNLHREIVYLAEAGIPMTEAIRAASRTGAELLGTAEDAGTVEPGKVADLVLVRGNLLEERDALHRVERVFLGGREIDVAKLLRESRRKRGAPAGGPR